MQRFSSATTAFVLRDDGILEGTEINPSLARTPEVIAETWEVIRTHTDGSRPPSLWDARSVPPFEAEVWMAFVEGVEASVSAIAILVDEGMGLGFEQFAPAIAALLVPIRLFDDRAEALAWLQGLGSSQANSL